MRSPLHGRTLLLGVTGSIAAYKAAFLASRLTQEGARVVTLLTPSATRFITPLTFQSLTGQPAYTQEDLWGDKGHVLHISLARQAEALLVVPCTADTLAQLAQGRAENLVSLAALALHPEAFLVIAPAMDADMFQHPQVQANLARLREQGARILGPVEGRLASGLVAKGRMVEPETILNEVRLLFARRGPLQGHHVVVTAGPTREPLDPVRVFTNRSTGRQGYALAEAARNAGARVTLISGPTQLPTPYGVHRIDVETAREMHQALMDLLPKTDILFKVAAVADYRPARMAREKVKKGRAVWRVTLKANPDLLQGVQAFRKTYGRPRWVVGFAAESRLDVHLARDKCQRKGLDLLLLNDITQKDAGFAVATNRGIVVDRFGHVQSFPLMPKRQVADLLVAWVLYLEGGRRWVHLMPWEHWTLSRQAGKLLSPFMEREQALPLARPDQVPRFRERFYPDLPPERLVALEFHGDDWAERWAWRWEDGEWWPSLRVQEPPPLEAVRPIPFP